MDESRIEKLLESRHEVVLEWDEPWAAFAPQGEPIDAHVTMRATVHDCVNMARIPWAERGTTHQGRDRELLLDFIAVHGARALPHGSPAKIIEAARAVVDTADDTGCSEDLTVVGRREYEALEKLLGSPL